MADRIPYTKILSDFYSKLAFGDIPAPDIARAKRLLLDYVGYAVRSREEEPARILQAFAAEAGGRPEATILGASRRTSCHWAALVNGAMGHMTELDDTHRGTMSHPGDSVLPSALATGERSGANGKTVLAAIIAGYDCALRAGYAVMPTHYTRGWHPSGTANAFGATVTAARVLGLTAGQTRHALGLAGTQTAGNFAHVPNRGMSKDLNPGKAAFNGVFSALLAEKGFTGAVDIFESPKGYLKLYSDSPSPDRLVDRLGEPFLIGEVAHKAFPGCFHLHSAREAALEIAQARGLTVEDIETITARIFSTGAWYVDDPEPWGRGKGLYGPRFSTQFQIALALCEGHEGLWASFDDGYTLARLKDGKIRKLMKRITVVHDEKLNESFPNEWASIVEIETTSGKTYKQRVNLPKGEPENPMSGEDLVRKFRMLAASAYSPRRIAAIESAVDRFERLKDISEFTKLLRP